MAADKFTNATILALRDLALQFPETNEGDSCVKRAFRARNKGFLYLGEKESSYNIMVKLGASVAEATGLAEAEPHRYTVGKFGWITITFQASDTPPPGRLERWIEESFRLQVPKALLEQLDS